MLVPWSIKQEKCYELIAEICDIIQKDMPSTLGNAFLPIYLHLHLYESEDIRHKGMEFLLQSADNSLYGLLKSDIKVCSLRYALKFVICSRLICFRSTPRIANSC